jgi:hypothetical protein
LAIAPKISTPETVPKMEKPPKIRIRKAWLSRVSIPLRTSEKRLVLVIRYAATMMTQILSIRVRRRVPEKATIFAFL